MTRNIKIQNDNVENAITSSADNAGIESHAAVGAPPTEVFPGAADEYDLDDDEEEAAEDHADDNHPDDDDDHDNGAGKPSAIRLLLEMMVNTIQGWKKIRRSKLSPEDVGRSCFYPLTAIASASCFVDMLYSETATLSDCMISAVTVFIALFFGNFLVLILERFSLPASHKEIADSKFGKVYVMYNLSTLALFLTLYNCLPMIAPILAFLPLWTIFLAARGARFFRFPEEKKGLLTTLLCIFIIGAPLAICWGFDLIL